MKRVLLTILLLTTICCCAAQPQRRCQIVEMEDNKEYIELIDKEYRLLLSEDSLQTHLHELRREIAATNVPDSTRQVMAAKIIAAEQMIFSLEQSREPVAERINTLEQRWIVNHLDRQPTRRDSSARSDSEKKAYIVFDDYFVRNLSSPDYTGLTESQRHEKGLADYLTLYKFNYFRLSTLDSLYLSIPEKERADSLYAVIEHMEQINQMIADSVEIIGGKVFDNKVYTYNYLLDAAGRTDLLALFEERMAQMKLNIADNNDKYQSDAIAAFPYRKLLTLSYEYALAEMTGNRPAQDSLRNYTASFNSRSYLLPRIRIEQRLFIDYQDATIGKSNRYGSANPIPQVVVPPRGTIYRILVGSYSRMQPVSIFRFAYPLAYLKRGTSYCYYAGGYATQEEAQRGVELLQKAGFRSAQIVQWIDGTCQSDEVRADSNTSKPQTGNAEKQQRCRIEIATAGSTLSATVREAIGRLATGKELSRVQSAGGYTFIVRTFSSRQQAQTLKDEIETLDKGLTVKIVDLAQ